jgi:hypothetical protein
MFSSQNKLSELLLLSCIAAFVVLSLDRWIENSVTLFANANGLPFAIGIIGLSVGIARGNLHPKHIPIAFMAMSGMLLFMNLIICAHIFELPYLEPLCAVGALIFGSFIFSFSVGSRLKNLFKTEDFRPWADTVCGFLWGFFLFVFTSVTGDSPALQLVIAGLLLVPHAIKFWRPAGLHLACLLLSLALLIVAWQVEAMNNVVWSIYHRFNIETAGKKDPANKNVVFVVVDHTLKDFYAPVDKGDNDVRLKFLKLPYLTEKPNTVLVLGAGLGEDISEALQAGANYVDAVEIDPVLIELGKGLNLSYASPRVHVINADPRNFVNNCDKKYDTIILRTLDFQENSSTLSHFKDVSLYTKESYRKCLKLLSPNGNLLLSCAAANSLEANLLCQRFYATAKQALLERPQVVGGTSSGWSPYLFRLSKTPPAAPSLHEVSPFNIVLFGPNAKFQIMNDDSPYICLRIAPLAFSCLALFVIAAGAIGLAPASSTDELEHMARDRQSLLVATGFTLVVSGAINRIELLFGSCWWVTATVYGAFLLIAWLIISARIETETGRIELLLYPTLLASLLISFLLPIHWLLNWGFLGVILILLVTVLPVVRILLILPAISARSKSLQKALVFNLLGSALGILMQPAAIILGNNSLFLLALIALVIAAYLDIKFGNKLAQVEHKPVIKRIA